MKTKKEILQSIDVSKLPDVVVDSNIFIPAIIRSSSVLTESICTPIAEVKNTKKIFFMQDETGLQVASCTFSPVGDMSLNYKLLSVAALKINQKTCLDQLTDKFQNLLAFGRPQEIPASLEQYWIDSQMSLAAAAVEKLAFQGDTAGATSTYLDATDGYLKLIEADATSQLGISFTGSISTTTLTVTAVDTGITNADGEVVSIKQGMLLTGANIASNPCYVISQLTGTTGGIGTYKVSYSQTAASGTIRANSVINPYPIFEGSQSTTTMTVSNVVQGQLRVGQTVTTAGGVSVTSQTILAQLTGEEGGVGTYTMSASQTIAAGSAMKAKFATFTKNNIVYILQDIIAAIPEELRLGNTAGYVMNIVLPSTMVQTLQLAKGVQLRDNYGNPIYMGSADGLEISESGQASYMGTPIKFSTGLPSNHMICTYKENLMFGTDILSDMDNLNILDMRNITGDLELRLIVPEFALGFQYGQGYHIVYIN